MSIQLLTERLVVLQYVYQTAKDRLDSLVEQVEAAKIHKNETAGHLNEVQYILAELQSLEQAALDSVEK